MSTSSLYFLAQVGKTSLIMALVGEEFPEEVSGEGMCTPPARALAAWYSSVPGVPAGGGSVWEVLTAPGAVTAVGLVQVRSVRTSRSSSRGGVFLSLCSDSELGADPACSSLCPEEGVSTSQGPTCCCWGSLSPALQGWHHHSALGKGQAL